MEPDAAQHPDLAMAFESLVRAASSLLLEFQLDLASATVSLARRARTASLSVGHEAEVRSVQAGVEGVKERIQLLPSPVPLDLEEALDTAVACLKASQTRELIPA